MYKRQIELSDVEAVTTEQITNKVFEMVDAIASHKQKRALEPVSYTHLDVYKRQG